MLCTAAINAASAWTEELVAPDEKNTPSAQLAAICSLDACCSESTTHNKYGAAVIAAADDADNADGRGAVGALINKIRYAVRFSSLVWSRMDVNSHQTHPNQATHCSNRLALRSSPLPTPPPPPRREGKVGRYIFYLAYFALNVVLFIYHWADFAAANAAQPINLRLSGWVSMAKVVGVSRIQNRRSVQSSFALSPKFLSFFLPSTTHFYLNAPFTGIRVDAQLELLHNLGADAALGSAVAVQSQHAGPDVDVALAAQRAPLSAR